MANFKAYKTKLKFAAKINGEYKKAGDEIEITSLELEKNLERTRAIRGENDTKLIHELKINQAGS